MIENLLSKIIRVIVFMGFRGKRYFYVLLLFALDFFVAFIVDAYLEIDNWACENIRLERCVVREMERERLRRRGWVLRKVQKVFALFTFFFSSGKLLLPQIY